MLKSDRFAIISDIIISSYFPVVGGDFQSPRIMKIQTKVCIFIIKVLTNVIKFYNITNIMSLHFAKQVLKDIQAETKEIQEKLLIMFQAIEEGANLTMPVARQMSGYPGLKELRVRDARGIVRVFYYIQQKDQVFILHLFRKKTQKTPQFEIETAMQRLKRMKEGNSGK